jgi:hypothetical protein
MCRKLVTWLTLAALVAASGCERNQPASYNIHEKPPDGVMRPYDPLKAGWREGLPKESPKKAPGR